MLIKPALQKVSIFKSMTDTQLEHIAGTGQVVSTEAGKVIFNQGDKADCVYLILEGRVKVHLQDDNGNEVVLRLLEKDDLFGEMALLDGGTRSASVSSITPCKFFILERESFLDFLKTSPYQIVRLFTDLSARMRENDLKSFQEQLARQSQHAEMEIARHRSVSQMVVGVAHEINTPLGITNTAASVIKKELTSEAMVSLTKDSKVKEMVDTVLEAVDLMQRNINRAHTLIQSFKHISVSQIADIKEKVNLSEIMAEVITLFKIEARKVGLEVELKDTLTEETREWIGYRGYLSRVILNLLTNIKNYAYPDSVGGKVVISITSDSDRKEPCFIITVQDFGKGIAPENLPKVFDHFFTTGRGKGGTGLGLSIVYNLVTSALKGNINIESEPDNGTTVSITFPQTITE